VSVLETPRLIFRGRVTWDPIVTNNHIAQYDENEAKTVFDARAPDVDEFRKEAIAAAGDGNWNPHGTHRSAFYDSRVVATDTGAGPIAADPIVNSPVSFTGMLVDLEPYRSFSSQLFFDVMSFGIQGGCRVFAPRTIRMTARYINFARNQTYRYIAGVASVVWQTSFCKEGGLRIDPHDSPALQQLANSLDDEDVLGLTVRWNAYRTLYFDSPDPSNNGALAKELQASLKTGGFQPNPARSEVVGVLGLWRKGEPASEPGDRALLTRQPLKIGSAHVRLSRDLLTLDLGNSIQETRIDLTKADLGDLTAVTVAADGTTVLATLGTFGYDAYRREAYEGSAGIVTINVDRAAARSAQDADIQLRQRDGTVLLAEAALRAIPAMPNTYLDQDDTTDLEVLVLNRGRPADAGIPVIMADPNSSTAASVVRATNAQGIATFPLAGTTGQVEGFVFAAGQGASVPEGVDPQSTTYVFIRTLPADDDIAHLPPTWDNVHRFVLRNWQAMAPCMDNWLDLGNPDQIRSFAPVLRRLTDKANFEAFRFMPVTRDMTAGQRALLYAFLDGGDIPTMVTEAATAPRSLARLSRAMRSGEGAHGG
jgi:hypothetical protein